MNWCWILYYYHCINYTAAQVILKYVSIFYLTLLLFNNLHIKYMCSSAGCIMAHWGFFVQHVGSSLLAQQPGKVQIWTGENHGYQVGFLNQPNSCGRCGLVKSDPSRTLRRIWTRAACFEGFRVENARYKLVLRWEN